MGDISKAERLDWARGGEHGSRRMVDVDELYVDHAYQRQPVNYETHLKIARNFSWIAFGVLAVMQRANGKMYIVDGQQRWIAAKLRGEKKVPCSITPSSGSKEEAEQFALLNTARTNMYSLEKFNAFAHAGAHPFVEIKNWLASQGFVVARQNGHSNCRVDGRAVIACISNVVKQWAHNEDHAQKAILASRDICQEHPIHYLVLRGCFALLQGGVDPSAHLTKILESGGMTAVLKGIKAALLEGGLAYASERMCGQIMVNIINKGRRSGRIKLVGAEVEQQWLPRDSRG